ncbi:hypothetical protein [Paracoccus homiensis]|uniref:Prophage tail length tape measure protein n=1 Tax=Paracoccus homiensis TaxID=364199 RepID=A0A1I0J0V7_9RHOB|nr:hypothetical protein [Paracoccus homiensis]SEU03325.1 hypothetical protein SAMN04489858_12065 [Paracoccus homiensis]
MAVIDRLSVYYDVVDDQAQAAFKRLERNSEAANRAMLRGAGQVDRAYRTLGTGGGIQNVAYQVGDFATQVGAGTSASVALGQQLPQLLGGFGALGAVMGAVVAIGVPLAAAFIGAGEGAGTLKERMDALNGAIRDYEEAIENANLTTSELVAKYGAATGAAREFLAALVEISQVESFQSLDAQMASLATRFGDLASVSADAIRGLQGPAAYADQIDAFNDLKNGLGLSTNQAIALREAIVAVGEADGPAQQAEAARQLQDEMIAVLGPVESMTEAQRAFYKELVISGDKAAQLVGDVGDVADAALEAAIQAGNFRDAIAQIDFSNPLNAAEDLSAVMGGLVGQAKSLVAYLGAAAQAANQKIQNAVARGNSLDPLGAFNSTGGSTGAFGDSVQIGAGGLIRTPVIPEITETSGGSSRRRSGGRKSSGGSGGSGRQETPFFGDIERDLVNLERQIELVGKSSEEVATLKARWELLDEAKKRGLNVDDELNGKIDAQAQKFGQLTAELERAEIAQEQFEAAVDGIADAMAGALVAGESLREGLAQVFRQIASDILSSGIRQALASSFAPTGGGGGGFGNIIGSLFGGFRANGGPVDAGKAYVVGERGPEIVVPGRNSTVIPNHAISGGGGSQNVNVTVSVDENGNLQAFVDKRAGQAAQRGISTYDKAMPARVQQINNKPWRR